MFWAVSTTQRLKINLNSPLARADIRFAEKDAEPDSWLRKLITQRNKNAAAVALANKNVCVVWVLPENDKIYEQDYIPTAQTAAS